MQTSNRAIHFFRSRFVDVGWLWERAFTDTRYISNLDINWIQISKVLKKTIKLDEHQVVGLLNFNSSEVNQWQKILAGVESVTLSVDHIRSDVTWETLYPEWIDEEEESEVPVCPSMPMSVVPKRLQLSLIAVKLPCLRSAKNWSRDVARLHLQLTAAKLAASLVGNAVHVLFVTDCWPIPNLFMCKELIVHDGNIWVYKPDLSILQKKLQLPVGSCELSVPLKSQGLLNSNIWYLSFYGRIV